MEIKRHHGRQSLLTQLPEWLNCSPRGPTQALDTRTQPGLGVHCLTVSPDRTYLPTLLSRDGTRDCLLDARTPAAASRNFRPPSRTPLATGGDFRHWLPAPLRPLRPSRPSALRQPVPRRAAAHAVQAHTPFRTTHRSGTHTARDHTPCRPSGPHAPQPSCPVPRSGSLLNFCHAASFLAAQPQMVPRWSSSSSSPARRYCGCARSARQ